MYNYLLTAILTTIILQCTAQGIYCKAGTATSQATKQLSIASQNTDVKKYRCYWETTPNVRYIKGNVTITYRLLTASSSITFDLINALTVDSVKYKNTLLTYSRPANALLIQFATNIAANTTDSVTIYYQGAPPTTEGYYATGTHSGSPITYSLSEPYGARYWWPCKDDVVDKADTTVITLKYPQAFTGVANGILLQETTDGTSKQSTWLHRKPIAAYLVAFAITNYTRDVRSLTSNGSPMPFINYVYPETMTSYNNSIANINSAFALFENRFGPYPFNGEQYAQSQIQQGVGGMEHQTNSFIDNWSSGLMAHELMHQWFGNKVTCNTWQDIWLNEGFASYAEVLYTENINGATARINEMKNRATSVTSSPAGSVYRYDTTTVSSIFNYRLTYTKASYVVHMLRWQLGDAAFYQACRNYLNAPGIAYSFATTDSLKKYMEAGLTGGGNLTQFFNDYVYGEGYPTYNIRWNQVGNSIIIQANQATSNATVPFYEMPIPIRFSNGTKDTTVILMHTSSGQVFNTSISFAATIAQFDPEAWILSRNNTVTFDTNLIPTATSNIIIDNSITLGPVPATQLLHLYNPANKRFKRIEVYNQLGALILSYIGNTTQLNIANLPSGRYIVKLIDVGNKAIIKSFVK